MRIVSRSDPELASTGCAGRIAKLSVSDRHQAQAITFMRDLVSGQLRTSGAFILYRRRNAGMERRTDVRFA